MTWTKDTKQTTSWVKEIQNIVYGFLYNTGQLYNTTYTYDASEAQSSNPWTKDGKAVTVWS